MQKHLLSLFLIFTAQNIFAEASNVTDQLNIINQSQEQLAKVGLSKEEMDYIIDTVIKAVNKSVMAEKQSNHPVKSELDKKYEKYLDVHNELANQELGGRIFAGLIMISILAYVGYGSVFGRYR